MDTKIKEKFIKRWEKYFEGAELPITFYYTNQARGAEAVKPSSGHRCIFADLCKVRTGKKRKLHFFKFKSYYNGLRIGKEIRFRFWLSEDKAGKKAKRRPTGW